MQINTEVLVDAPAEKAWQIIGEKFGDFGEWTTALDSSFLKGTLGVGAIRVCHTRSVGLFPPAIVEEQLIDFDPKHHRYTYIVTKGMPSMFKKAQNSWSIESISQTSCIIHSHVVLELKLWLRPFSWLLTMLLKRDMKKFFAEMAYFIEYGKVHPRKAKSSPEPVKT